MRVLCPPDFLKPDGQRYIQDRSLQPGPEGTGMAAKLRRAAADTTNRLRLAAEIVRHKPDFVLLSANAEYRAVLWGAPHIALHRAGTIYLTNFHDHRFLTDVSGMQRANLRLAYAMLDGGLDHGGREDAPYLPRRMVVREAPFGSFSDIGTTGDGQAIRVALGIPEGAKVALAFGHIRDAKNLDTAIRAIARLQGAHLLIAGEANSTSQKPISHYRALAAEFGIDGGVHFIDRFIRDDEVPDIFASADAAVLPYSADFRSASGVMHLAARMGVPVVASGGPGPLMRTMRDYPIGETFEVLDDAAMARALQKVFCSGRAGYADGLEQLRRSLSWEHNVDLLLEVAREVRQRRGLQ